VEEVEDVIRDSQGEIRTDEDSSYEKDKIGKDG
jgi:hypothetical protein